MSDRSNNSDQGSIPNNSALEAAQAFIERAEVLNQGAGATLEDAFAQSQPAMTTSNQSEDTLTQDLTTEPEAKVLADTVVLRAHDSSGQDEGADNDDAVYDAEERRDDEDECDDDDDSAVEDEDDDRDADDEDEDEDEESAASYDEESEDESFDAKDADLALGSEPILHHSPALEDDPALKAAQVLALDNAKEAALHHGRGENLNVPPIKPVDNPENLKTAGQILRYNRQRMGLSVNQVADKLKTRATIIFDIEGDRLNTPNVAKMVGALVVKYAKLLHLNADEIYSLYQQGIKENVIIEHVIVAKKSEEHRMGRIWLLIVLIILVAAGGYLVFGDEDDTNLSQGTLVAPDAAVDTSSALVTSDSKLTVVNETAPVVIDAEPSANAPKVLVLDENTAKALSQQQELKQHHADQAKAEDAQRVNEQPQALLLPEGVVHEDVAQTPIAEPAVPTVEVAVPSAKPANTSNEMQASAQASAAAPFKSQEPIALPAVPVSVQSEPTVVETIAPTPSPATVDTNLNAKLPEDKEVLKPATLAPQPNKVVAEKPKVTAPKLAASQRDISRQVRVVGRDGLASLNRAEIAVTKAVALEVIDGLNKTVRSGSFKAGEVVKITAIPPIVVKLSDTSAVKISYMGGTIALPPAQQVRFALPQR